MTPEQLAEARRICDAFVAQDAMADHETDRGANAINFYRHVRTAYPEVLAELAKARRICEPAGNLTPWIRDVIAKHDRLKAEIERLQKENAELRSDISLLIAERDSLDAENEHLRRESPQ